MNELDFCRIPFLKKDLFLKYNLVRLCPLPNPLVARKEEGGGRGREGAEQEPPAALLLTCHSPLPPRRATSSAAKPPIPTSSVYLLTSYWLLNLNLIDCRFFYHLPSISNTTDSSFGLQSTFQSRLISTVEKKHRVAVNISTSDATDWPQYCCLPLWRRHQFQLRSYFAENRYSRQRPYYASSQRSGFEVPYILQSASKSKL